MENKNGKYASEIDSLKSVTTYRPTEITQLPPELVSEILDTIFMKRGGHESNIELSEQCAQIAVDYADEKQDEIDLLKMSIRGHEIMQGQRSKEICEVVRGMILGFNDLLRESKNPNKAEDFTFVKRAIELIEKYK